MTFINGCTFYFAFIPTFQLSIDYYKPASYHFELAKQLGFLRNKGVLIIGSGNLVHNLGMVDFANTNGGYDWAIEFDATVKNLLDKGDFKSLVEYEKLSKDRIENGYHFTDSFGSFINKL